jgi:cytidine deaminase
MVLPSSDVPAPTTTPCGICRQFIREFCPDTTPVYMVSSTFPAGEMCSQDDVLAAMEDPKMVRKVTFGELLPMSFGPENLA